MKYIKWILSITFISLVFLLATALLALLIKPHSVTIQNTEENPANRRLGVVLELLIACESGGRIDVVNYDDGAVGLHSYGVLQFQRPTFEHYWRTLVNPDVDSNDIDNLHRDPEAQKILAEAMITDNPKNLNHWLNCTKKHDLLTKL